MWNISQANKRVTYMVTVDLAPKDQCFETILAV